MGSNYGSTDSLERQIIRKGFPPIQGKMSPNLLCRFFLSLCNAFTTRSEHSVTLSLGYFNLILIGSYAVIASHSEVDLWCVVLCLNRPGHNYISRACQTLFKWLLKYIAFVLTSFPSNRIDHGWKPFSLHRLRNSSKQKGFESVGWVWDDVWMALFRPYAAWVQYPVAHNFSTMDSECLNNVFHRAIESTTVHEYC